jgi:hypothetical protein
MRIGILWSSLIFSLFLLNSVSLVAGDPTGGVSFDKKGLEAVRTAVPPRIDGYLDDIVWEKAPIATDFVQYSPFSGRPASFRTEVRVLYDDEALYIAAMMYDPNPDSIFLNLGQRDSDRNLNADMFHVEISTFNDGLNGETFKISASGVQSDMKATPGSEGGWGGGGDRNWDAVWESSVTVTGEGWIAELRIPFSALRFPRLEEQTWGINFWREIRRYREESSWSYVDREIGTSFNHLGELKGLKNLVPPVRLSLVPYLSGYVERFDGDRPGLTWSGGLDVKYGVSESFTFDATLIPDFGQVQSDDQVLNLTPYEVKYNERRPFFMEGTELFSRGDIFYSRRIGTRPKLYHEAYDQPDDGEVLLSNPQEAAMINASKLSGRFRNGLGVGVFNAMTNNMYAEIENLQTGDVRRYKTEPFTNYNMLVLDQSLRNNSYVSLANTNVWRSGERDENYYTANVTATDFKLQNNTRLYSVSGKVALSQKYYDELSNRFGHRYEFSGGKTGGTLRLDYRISGVSDSFDPNDMGFLRRNNEFRQTASVAYNTHQPFWKIYTTRTSLSYSYNQLHNPRVFTGSSVDFSSMIILSNYWMVTLRGGYKPGGEDDYYEPRVPGRFYHTPKEGSLHFKFDTDRSKRYYFDFSASTMKRWSEHDQSSWTLTVEQEVKVSTRMSAGLDLSGSRNINDIGFVSFDGENDDIIFGKRDNSTFTTTINSEFIFTADSYLTFRLRHYWSKADYDDNFYSLTDNGRLEPGAYTGVNPDFNYNAFNVDMVYTWRFAPGSELTVVWKNSIPVTWALAHHWCSRWSRAHPVAPRRSSVHRGKAALAG